MMPLSEKKKNIVGVRLSDSELDYINKVAKKLEIEKSKFIRNLVLTALDDVKILNRLGIYDAVMFVRKARKRRSESSGTPRSKRAKSLQSG